MNQHEILKEYLTALYRAEVVVTDNQLEPLCFNGVRSLTDYRIHLLDVELPAIACLREIRRKEEEDDVLAVSVREALLELQTIFGEEDGHATHRYLTITNGATWIARNGTCSKSISACNKPPFSGKRNGLNPGKYPCRFPARYPGTTRTSPRSWPCTSTRH